MAKAYIFYNQEAGSGQGKNNAFKLQSLWKDDTVLCDLKDSATYERYLFEPQDEDYFIICGGDGTLNRLVNLIKDADLDIQREVLYLPSGRQNDFAKSIGKASKDEPFSIGEYLRKLPYVVMEKRKIYFLNRVDFGIGAYYTKKSEETKSTKEPYMQKKSKLQKNILKEYLPRDAKITVDGVPHIYGKVWFTHLSNNSFLKEESKSTVRSLGKEDSGLLSITILHGCSGIRALHRFSLLRLGKIVKKKKTFETLVGKHITVEYNEGTALLIDGETFKSVSSFEAVASEF